MLHSLGQRPLAQWPQRLCIDLNVSQHCCFFSLSSLSTGHMHTHRVSRSPPTPGHTGRQQQALCLNDNPTAAEATAAVAGKGIPRPKQRRREAFTSHLSLTLKVHIVHNVLAKLADGGYDDTARASGLVSK